MSAPIQIVDEYDRPVGEATKQEAWDKGLIHRVVRIMIEDNKGRILLQHRSPTKIPYPELGIILLLDMWMQVKTTKRPQSVSWKKSWV